MAAKGLLLLVSIFLLLVGLLIFGKSRPANAAVAQSHIAALAGSDKSPTLIRRK